MQLRQIRNATIDLFYGGRHFLIDPVLGKGACPSFPALPCPVKELVSPDAVIVTDLCADHFDNAARELLPKTIPVYVPGGRELQVLSQWGFTDVRVLGENCIFDNVQLSKAPVHPAGQTARMTGEACGVILEQPSEKTLYITGDTLWCPEVESTLKNNKPRVILVNCGCCRSHTGEQLTMGKEDVKKIHDTLPKYMIIATHMEAMDHCTLTRKELRDFAAQEGFSKHLLIPEDGEILYI